MPDHAAFPLGGTKKPGFGREFGRELGCEGARETTNRKTIVTTHPTGAV